VVRSEPPRVGERGGSERPSATPRHDAAERLQLPPGELATIGDGLDRIEASTVQSEDLVLDPLRERGIALTFLELLGDVEGPHGLDLILR
jgi:hypothetical protein